MFMDLDVDSSAAAGIGLDSDLYAACSIISVMCAVERHEVRKNKEWSLDWDVSRCGVALRDQVLECMTMEATPSRLRAIQQCITHFDDPQPTQSLV